MKALVLGAGGFIGHNLVKRLVREGWDVEGVDLHYPKWEDSEASFFHIGDLNKWRLPLGFDRIYQLAADMGGAGFVFTGDNDAEILTNSLSINLNVLKQLKDFKGKVFYSSSVCVYPDGVNGREFSAYPANPPSNYGWEKLTSERLYEAYGENYGLDYRIARFHNTYGPFGTYEGGREKAPAALCRKAIKDDVIEIWGDGEQIRPFIYIDDLLDAIEVLMEPDFMNYEPKGPVNIGPDTSVTINQMVDLISDKPRKYIDGPTGELKRRTNNDLIKSMGWKPKTPLKKGLKQTKDWIESVIWATSKP